MHFVDSTWTKTYFILVGLSGTVLNMGILLVLMSCKNNMGGYRSLMGAYVLVSMTYSIYNLFVRPIVMINEDGWLLYGSGLIMNQEFGSIPVAFFCSMAALLLVALSFSYIFRYLTVCRREGVFFIQKFPGLSALAVVVIFASVAVTGTSFIYLLPDQETNSVFKQSFQEEFGRSIEKSPYFGCIAYRRDSLNPTFGLTFGIRFGMCVYCTIIMVACGYRIYSHLRAQAVHMSSNAPFIRKQKRLFTLLLAQSTVPILTFYFPLGIGFLLAAFRLNFPIVCKMLSIIMPISAVIDPILIFCNVSQYRRFVYYKCGCQKLDVYRMKRSMEQQQSLAKTSAP